MRQLLAFSRKQMLQPRVIDLNSVVEETEVMLRRLIGADVELVARLDPDLQPVKADPGQLQQVIVNLALNARDAMPGGGRLELATRSESAVVVLTVTDTGHGMDEETLAHLFEPFFTTKEPGKGTGLGLATAYGILEQSGGTITARSEPSLGTTFEIRFPSAVGRAEALAAPASAVAAGGSETVLLVEDYAVVGELVRQVLDSFGYGVIAAADGVEALEVAARHEGSIDLLLTDLVMPKMGGRELADRLRSLRPGTKVLYMSGYADAQELDGEQVSEAAGFIAKPFAPNELACKVRDVLDGPSLA